MAQIKLAEYTFDNSVANCLPKFTGISTSDYTYEDTVNDNITTRIIYTTSTKTITKISFQGKTSLLTVSYLINTKYANDMFNGCTNLTSINVPGWDITGGTSYENMFYNCHSLKSLDLSSFTSTSVVTNMGTMFYTCKALTYLNLSSFDTSNLTTANAMFSGCTSLKELDLTSFNTSRISNSKYMFEGWKSSQTVYISSKWTLGTGFPPTFITTFANIIAKYKFNRNICPEFIPTFNNEFTDYIITDSIDTDGFTIRTVGNDSGNLPTIMQFGNSSNTSSTKSLLEVYECNTSEMTNMTYMFSNCTNLTFLDLSGFNTEKVVSMNYMFSYCYELTSLNLSSFNTSKVTSMSRMFQNCRNLTSLDLTNFNTEKVADMIRMFYGCSRLTSLNLSSFNTERITNMSYMFGGCSALTSLELLSFNTQKVTTMTYMFNNCSNLTSLDVSNFNTEKVDNMSYMFNNCYSLNSLDLKSFNTQKVTDTNYMFTGWSSSQTVHIGKKWTLGTNFPPTFIIAFAHTIAKYKFDQNRYESFIPTFNDDFTDYVYNDEIDTDGYTIRTLGNDSGSLPTLMQFGTASVETKSYSLLSVLKCNTDNIISMSEMFNNSRNLTSINLSSFNTQNVTNMGAMFKNCTSLTSLDLSNFNTNQVTSMGSMFYGCSNLTSLDLSSFNTEKITNTYGMFYGCSNLTSLNLSSFNTEKITSMNSMFYGCQKLTSLDLSNFNTQSVTNMSDMFFNCGSLTTLDLSNWNTSKVTNMSNMFNGCSALTTVDLSNFDTSKVSAWGSPSGINKLTNIGLVYASSSTINSIVTNWLGTSVARNVYYMDAELSELTTRANITYVPYSQSVLSCSEEITLRSNGDVYDELDLLTGQVIQRIGEDNEILEEEIVRTVELDGEIGFYENSYIHTSSNEITPEFEFQPTLTNCYVVSDLKPNTQYTVLFEGNPTRMSLGGTTIENPISKMIITSGEVDNILWFDTSVSKIMILEGDLTNRDIEYFTGVKSSQKIEVQLRGNTPYFAKGGRK